MPTKEDSDPLPDYLQPGYMADQALAVVPPSNPMAMLGHMVLSGYKADELGKMMDLAERWEAKQAEKAFNEAMAACQADMPTLVCDSFNPQTKSPYISLAGMLKQIKPVYTKHGFSLQFGEDKAEKENHCRITLDVGHKLGHSRHQYMDIPLDGVGIKGNANMTAIHGKLSSDTYATTRLVRKAFNLTVADDATDKDGNVDEVTPEQIQEAKQLFDDCRSLGGFTLPAYYTRFLQWWGDFETCTTLEQVPPGRWKVGIAALKKRLEELDAPA